MTDYAPILAAEYANAAPRSWIIVPPGDYDIDSTCILEGKPVQLDLRGATFHVRQELNGPALALGFADASGSDNQHYGLTVWGGRVRWQDDGGDGYAANNTTGFRVRNVRLGAFDGLAVDGLGTGIEIIGDGHACTGNGFYDATIRNCVIGIHEHSTLGGFSTYHTIDGAWFSQGGRPYLAQHLFLEAGNNQGGSIFHDCYFQGTSAGTCTVAAIDSGGYYCLADCGYESNNHTKMPLVLAKGTYNCTLRGWTNPDFDWQDANDGATKNLAIR